MRIPFPAPLLALLGLLTAGCASSSLSSAQGQPQPPLLTRAPVACGEVLTTAPAHPSTPTVCAVPSICPPVARLRPTEAWTFLEAWRTGPVESAAAAARRDACRRRARKRSLWLTAAAPVAVVAYGALFWDYGSSGMGVVDEGWFEQDARHGGFDKTGHFTSGHVLTAAYSALYRHWGLSRRESAARGAVSAFLTQAAIEVADGTSARQGFSFSDLAADAGGCLFGYFHETSPWLNRVVDLRWEYVPNKLEPGANDVTTDYEQSAHLLAFNVGALLSREPSGWDLLDLQAGYFARGYDDYEKDKEQWVFLGVGLNVANLLRRIGFRYAVVFDYLQLPFVSLRFGVELNDGETRFLWHP